ncbi:MAG: hypothetical protein GTO02_08885, partial [Candidatus Dadabacteria bacterium]|nr:hypothetical protein [Candidatus Dadabacteria bacterium]
MKNTYPQLAEINKFLNLKLTDESILFGIEESTKEKMLLKDDPDRPEGAVRVDSENNKTDFNNMDREFFLDAIKKYLKY